MVNDFDELRKALARANELIEILCPDATKSYVEPVVGQETPLDAIVLVQGVGTMSRASLIKEIRQRISECSLQTCPLCKINHKRVYYILYGSGFLKAMLETAIRHQGSEL